MSVRSVDFTQHKAFILENLPRFHDMKVLVIGDVGVDEYVSGEVRRISPEAPVPVLEVSNEDVRLGLSGNVAQNIASLGGTCHLLSVVGRDGGADQLRGLLKKAGVSDQYLVEDSSRPTTRKLRVMAGHHHIVRVDYEQKRHLETAVEERLLQRAEACLRECQGLILQDYAKGVLSQSVIQKLVTMARAMNKKILVDPHRTTPVAYYRGVDLITPNYEESLALAGIESDDFSDPEQLLSEVGAKLMATTGSSHLVLTRGKKGMRLLEDSGAIDLPTFARQVFDVTGAGDTVIAMLSLAWLSGFTLEQACVAANFAAGVVVGKIGCVPCSVSELRDYIAEH